MNAPGYRWSGWSPGTGVSTGFESEEKALPLGRSVRGDGAAAVLGSAAGGLLSMKESTGIELPPCSA